MTPMKSIVVASLLSVGALASQAAVAADTVTIKWAGVDTAGTRLSAKDESFSADVAVTSNYAATALNYSCVTASTTSRASPAPRPTICKACSPPATRR
jgi:hypothetical protein